MVRPPYAELPTKAIEPSRMTLAEQTAMTAMQEAHDSKQWGALVSLGDAWIDAYEEMPAIVAILYAEGLMWSKRIEDAMKWACHAVVTLKPYFRKNPVLALAAYTTYARALSRAGQFGQARRVLLESTFYTPSDNDESLEKLGHIRLSIGKDWRRGWKLLEKRLSQPEKALWPNLTQWDGYSKEPISVLHEQGIGDAVMFARFLPMVAKYTGFPVTWYGPKILEPWMAEIEGVVVGDLDKGFERKDVSAGARIMSLPHLLRVKCEDQLPPPIAPASLLANRTTNRAWRSSDAPFRVGICWKGSSSGWHDFERSYSPDEFAPVCEDAANIEFVNLCHDAEVGSLPFGKVSFSDIYETGKALALCDIVVSVDTSVAHLSASMGIPTICLIPTVADWRWNWPAGKTTPWYRSAVVVRRKNMLDMNGLAIARKLLLEAERATRPVLEVANV